jgi:hypothetical protein
MTPWWDNIWIWSGIGVAVGALIAAIVVIFIIAGLSRPTRRP